MLILREISQFDISNKLTWPEKIIIIIDCISIFTNNELEP